MTTAPYDVICHHMGAFGHDVVAEMVSDYAPDAIMVLPQMVLQGVDAIRDFFALQRAGVSPPRLDSIVHPATGTVVTADWTIGAGSSAEMRGRDVFVVTDGKIRYQTVYIGDVPPLP